MRILADGERLTDLNEVSRFESAVYFNDQRFQSPWIKVKTADHQTGWVFAEALRPLQKDTGWMLQKRLACYFGEALAGRRNRFLNNPPARNDAELAAAYREVTALRDTLMYLLAHRAEPDEAGFRPDFSWLTEVLPHFVYQTTANGSRPYLFADYRYWQNRAAQIGGAESMAFFNTCLTAFATDSIESFFPCWTFQVSEQEAASQLGLKKHLAMLQSIQTASEAGPLYQSEILRFKEALLEDILDKKTVYWQPESLIINELKELLTQDFSCLNDRDRMALRARLTMFEQAAANGIKVNLRSGM